LEVAGHDLHKRDVSADMDKSILYRKTIRLWLEFGVCFKERIL
jgi:hypothetical protein